VRGIRHSLHYHSTIAISLHISENSEQSIASSTTMSLKLLALFGCIATVFAQQDSSSVKGIVLTSRKTNTFVEKSTSFVPVATAVVQTNYETNVNTNRQTLTETTDFGKFCCMQ
jgi:hypothetical protein